VIAYRDIEFGNGYFTKHSRLGLAIDLGLVLLWLAIASVEVVQTSE
jgi:hypothetical protein